MASKKKKKKKKRTEKTKQFNLFPAYFSCFQITTHFDFDQRKWTVTQKCTQGTLFFYSYSFNFIL